MNESKMPPSQPQTGANSVLDQATGTDPHVGSGVAPVAAADALSKRRLKMWIRLLGVTRAAEGHLREFLRVQHGTTLPRFDVMAALWRRREGVTMTELSRMLLVSNGNATTVVDRLEKDGLVRRTPSQTDRRTVHVALTDEGLVIFEKLAAGHETELNALFSTLTEDEIETITTILKRMRRERE